MTNRTAWSAARRVARVVLAAEMTAATRDPQRLSVIGWIVASAVLSIEAFALLGSRVPWPLLVLAGLVLAGMCSAAAAGLGALVGARRSERCWIVPSGDAVAVGYVRRTPRGWKLHNVAAWPLGRGAGAPLVSTVVADAIAAGQRLELVPSTPRVRAWYRRQGFEPCPVGRALYHPATAGGDR